MTAVASDRGRLGSRLPRSVADGRDVRPAAWLVGARVAEPIEAATQRTPHMPTFPLVPAFLSLPNGTEWIIILVIGLLLFGRRLPEVGRSIGRSIVEFKKGIKGIEEEIEQESTARPGPRPASRSNPQISDRIETESASRAAQPAAQGTAAAPHDGH